MKLLVATGNRHKLQEFSRILSPLGIKTVSPADVGVELDVEETGTTFSENARIKAEALYKLTGLATVADDSGLCVDALDGRPGVYSARYMGDAPHSEKIKGLLGELENVPDDKRTARFMCAICGVLGDSDIIEASGSCEGKIAYEPSGEGGFGYDPIFLCGDKSFAALSDAEKDAVSHRGKALEEFAAKVGIYLKNKEKN